MGRKESNQTKQSTQSKKLKDAILVAFDRGKCGLENGV